MTHPIPIELQIAKEQLVKINKHLNSVHLLIGGLAVQKYVVTRKSKDIDLVCDYDVARNLVHILYPTHEWEITDSTDDAYRANFKIRHLHKDLGEIIFGPKVLERTPYNFIDWKFLLDHGLSYVFQGSELENILIPRCSDLAYTKLISFLGRDRSKKSKRENDLQDFTDLTNQGSFSIRDFLALISRSGAEEYIRSNFNLTQQEESIFYHSSIRRPYAIFQGIKKNADSTTLSLPPITSDEAKLIKQNIQNAFRESPLEIKNLKLMLGICSLDNSGFGVSITVIGESALLTQSVKQFFMENASGYCQFGTLAEVSFLSSDFGFVDLRPQPSAVRVGARIANATRTTFGTIGAFLLDPKTQSLYLLTAAHVIGTYENSDPRLRDVYLASPKSSGEYLKIAELVPMKLNDKEFSKIFSIAKLLPHIPVEPILMPNEDFLMSINNDTNPDNFRVRKNSLSSDSPIGTISAFSLDGYVKISDNEGHIFRNMIEVSTTGAIPFAVPGDSGALVTTATGRIVGLVMAGAYSRNASGEESVTFVAPILEFIRSVQLELLTTKS